MAAKEKFVIFDGNALVHRAFHALPPLATKDGLIVNAVYGFATIFLRVLKELKPKYVAVTFDLPGGTFRHQAYKEYKAQRVKAPQELYDQIPLVKELVSAFPLKIYEAKGYEADDVIGTLTKKVEEMGLESIIVTGDMDALQLVDKHTKIYTLKHGLSETMIYDIAAVKERFGLAPEQMIDYKALRGDPSDNIPGVTGIGEKTAGELIKEFGSLENLYKEIKNKSKKLSSVKQRVLDLLVEQKKQAEMSQMLATIVRDVNLKFDLGDCAVDHVNGDELVKLFSKFEFKSLLPRIPQIAADLKIQTKQAVKIKGEQKYELVDSETGLKKMLKVIEAATEIAVDTETTSVDPWQSELVGISLAIKAGEGWFVSAKLLKEKTPTVSEFIKILEDEKVKKIGHNIKYDWESLAHFGIELKGVSFDTMVAAYLLHAGSERNLDLNSLAFREFSYQMQPIEDLIGPRGKNQVTMADVALDKVAWYAAEDADFTWRLKEKLGPHLKSEKLLDLFNDIEMPLIKVLGLMEKHGVKIDDKFLESMAERLNSQLENISAQIIKLAGQDFNIASPKQLKEILFDKLKISPQGIKKIKTGFSTAASELEKMRGAHPIIDLIVDHRELSKLLSTYIEALPQLINKDTGRVHTSFNQTVAATGRLSSSDPNLQNIPIKGDLGKEIRRAFIAEKGNLLISADYSQIELRLAAHIAQDDKMKGVFTRGEDFHRATAAFVFGVKPEEVTQDQRRQAKEVNFGILYGMGAWGLSERTGIPREEARFFIDKYFSEFSALAKWIENTKEQVRETGEVFTMLGRRRKIPEINAGVAQIRAQGERMAVNLPIQGTAADLMKLAMIKVAAKLPEISAGSSMTLQVHDELVFEVPEADVMKVARFVKEEMEGALKVSVPIVVDVKQGKNWGEMEEIKF